MKNQEIVDQLYNEFQRKLELPNFQRYFPMSELVIDDPWRMGLSDVLVNSNKIEMLGAVFHYFRGFGVMIPPSPEVTTLYTVKDAKYIAKLISHTPDRVRICPTAVLKTDAQKESEPALFGAYVEGRRDTFILTQQANHIELLRTWLKYFESSDDLEAPENFYDLYSEPYMLLVKKVRLF